MINDYKKYAGKIHTEVRFTMFDKEYLISLGEQIKELENNDQRLRDHIRELETRLLKCEEE